MQPRILELRKNVLKKNDELARELRRRYLSEQIYTINLGVESRDGKDDVAGTYAARADRIRLRTSRRLWAIWPRIAMPSVWPAAAPRCDRSPPTAAVIWRPKW